MNRSWFVHLVFVLAVLVQLGIVIYPSAQKIAIRSVPENVITLRTKPVDPYDVMRGYYMTLNFEISEPPGFTHDEGRVGETVYTVLERGDDEVWNAVSTSYAMPALKQGQRIIKGWVAQRSWRGLIMYGIEKYFVPETMGEEIEQKIRDRRQQILVDVAVDEHGDGAVLRLHVGDAVYEY